MYRLRYDYDYIVSENLRLRYDYDYFLNKINDYDYDYDYSLFVIDYNRLRLSDYDYSKSEADMHLIYSRVDGNGRLAERLYPEQQPRSRRLNYRMFSNLDRRLW